VVRDQEISTVRPKPGVDYAEGLCNCRRLRMCGTLQLWRGRGCSKGSFLGREGDIVNLLISNYFSSGDGIRASNG
jgi:hypothetical protein